MTANRISTGSYCALSTYPAQVAADAPYLYYRLAETSGTSAADNSGNGRTGTYAGGYTTGAGGALACTTDPAVTFTNNGFVYPNSTTAVAGPNLFSIEAWFKTTSTTGGRIVGFGNNRTGTATKYDRHLYLTNAGILVFGARPGTTYRTVASTTSLNDGLWHHTVAVLSPAGMALYVDGVAVASRSDTTTAENYSGYWRVGTDNINGWLNTPTDRGLTGTIDEVAVYTTALSATRVAAHHLAGRIG